MNNFNYDAFCTLTSFAISKLENFKPLMFYSLRMRQKTRLATWKVDRDHAYSNPPFEFQYECTFPDSCVSDNVV